MKSFCNSNKPLLISFVILTFLFVIIYLKGRAPWLRIVGVGVEELERERERDLSCGFTPQMAVVTKAGPGQSQ